MLKAGLVEFNWTFVFQIVNTFILYLVLKKFLFVPVTDFVDRRQEEIRSSINYAERINEEAESLKKEYENKLDKVNEEGQEILFEAREKAVEKGNEIINESKEKASAIQEKARKDIEQEKKKSFNELKDEISSLAILAASKVLENEVDEKENAKLVDRFIEEVGESKWQN